MALFSLSFTCDGSVYVTANMDARSILQHDQQAIGRDVRANFITEINRSKVADQNEGERAALYSLRDSAGVAPIKRFPVEIELWDAGGSCLLLETQRTRPQRDIVPTGTDFGEQLNKRKSERKLYISRLTPRVNGTGGTIGRLHETR